MTIMLAPVSSDLMGTDGPVLGRTDVADLLGVTPLTITRYRYQSRAGGPYERAPFPEPDGHIGRNPYWLPERADDIKAWAAARPRHGVGGRPRKRP